MGKTFAKLANSKSQVTILTNIGLQTHRVIGAMCGRLGRGLLSLEDVEKQFKRYYADQLKILSELKKYGDVHLIEDPNFYMFNNTDKCQVMKYNFEIYVKFLDKHCQNAGLKYHSLSRGALISILEKTGSSFSMKAVSADGYHGTHIFYQQQLKILKDVVDLK